MLLDKMLIDNTIQQLPRSPKTLSTLEGEQLLPPISVSVFPCKNCITSVDAVKNGHINCLKSLFIHKDKRLCDYAAINGYLECLVYAHERGCKWDSNTCKYAYKSANYKCVKYMLDHGCEVNYIGVVTECYMYMYFL